MADTINRIVVAAVDSLYDANPNLFVTNGKAFYINAIQEALNAELKEKLTLITNEPDYERVFLQITQNLSEDENWYDLIVSSTASSLLRPTAAGITYAQFSIERAVQETFLHSASAESSVFAATRMLGVRPRRRLPAVVDVDVTRDDSTTIVVVPKLSQFTIQSFKFYNREQITFQQGQLTASIRLYQGLVVSEEVTSTGEPFQKFEFGNSNGVIADSDFKVEVNDEEWTYDQTGLWNLDKNSKAYFESTSVRQNMEIRFGNFGFGAIPAQGAIIRATYIETLGIDGNIPASNLECVLDEEIDNTIDIRGFTTSNVYAGDAALSTNYYKQMAPHLFSSKRRAVRRSDFRAIATTYAGVKDALFRGQAELAPGRRSMMNVVGVTLLTDTAWTTGQFTAWAEQFKEEHAIHNTQFIEIPPIEQVVDVTGTIYCKPDTNLDEAKSKVEALLTTFFEPKLDHLGFSVYRTDISDIMNGRNDETPDEDLERAIEYVILNSPTADFEFTDKTYYASLGTMTITADYTTRSGFSGRLDLQPTTL